MSAALDLINELGVTTELLALLGLGLGVFIILFGLSGTMAGQSPQSRRMNAASISSSFSADFDLIRGDDNDPHRLLKAFVPSSKKERTKIAKTLRQAGLQRRFAVGIFYAVRTALGLVLPMLFILALVLPSDMQAAIHIDGLISGISWAAAFQIVTALMVVGFYGPSIWLRTRIRKRRQAIKFGFPNALDLLQVSVEAGLGVDASMVRVSHEMASVSPEISQEFMMLQLEIQAGKERQNAFLDMADRTGVDEVSAFSNVILQASQFGSSVSTALNTFASEMRLDRELRAQEKANRLPVQMSAVMAIFMMPVLLMICLTPMLIRWITMFG